MRVGDRFFLIDTDAPVNFTGTFTSTEAFSFEPLIEPGKGLFAVVTAIPEPAFGIVCGLLCVLALRRGDPCGWRTRDAERVRVVR